MAESLTGWTAGAAHGIPLTEVFRIVNEETRETVENPASRAIRDGVIVGLANHTILIARDGQERAIDDSAAPIRDGDGRIVGSVLIFRDVSSQRLAQRQILESESRKNAILDAAIDCIITCDHQGKIIDFNPAAERTFGYRRQDVIDRAMSEIIIPPAYREKHQQGMERFLSTGERRILGKRVVMSG